MKTYSKFTVLILIAFLLSACGATASATPEVALDTVYTAAAETLAVQAVSPTTTMAVLPTFVVPTTQILPTYSSLPTAAASPASYTASYSSGSTALGCNDALYVSDVTIPDGTVLSAGEEFTKTWEFQNTGTCAWSEDYSMVFSSGSQMSGEATEIDQTVAVGSTADISVELIAPTTAGTYTGYWRLTNADGSIFGQSVYVQIVVSTSATTTATATETTASSAATSTPTATTQPTTAPTETPVPTIAPTETSIPTTATTE